MTGLTLLKCVIILYLQCCLLIMSAGKCSNAFHTTFIMKANNLNIDQTSVGWCQMLFFGWNHCGSSGSFLTHQIGISIVLTNVRYFYLTLPYQPLGNIKYDHPHAGRTSIRDVIVMLI